MGTFGLDLPLMSHLLWLCFDGGYWSESWVQPAYALDLLCVPRNEWSYTNGAFFDIFWILAFIKVFALNLGSSFISGLVQLYPIILGQVDSEMWKLSFCCLGSQFYFLYCFLILDSYVFISKFQILILFWLAKMLLLYAVVLINHIHLLNAHYLQISSSGICFVWKTYRQVRCFLLWSHASGVDYRTTAHWLFSTFHGG